MFQNLHPKCSNPSCAEAFEWLRGGKLFRFHRERDNLVLSNGPICQSDGCHHVEHFWLCERCANIFTLEYMPGQGVSIRMLWPELPAAENEVLLLQS
jgi:hypothetical protein